MTINNMTGNNSFCLTSFLKDSDTSCGQGRLLSSLHLFTGLSVSTAIQFHCWDEKPAPSFPCVILWHCGNTVTQWLDGSRFWPHHHLGHLNTLRLHYQQPEETIHILLVPVTGELGYSMKSYSPRLKAVTVVDDRKGMVPTGLKVDKLGHPL